MSAYSEAKKRRQMAESADHVAEGLEAMQEIVRAQDTVIQTYGKIIRDAGEKIDTIQSATRDVTGEAASLARSVGDMLIIVRNHIEQLKRHSNELSMHEAYFQRLQHSNVWGRLKFLLTGEIPL